MKLGQLHSLSLVLTRSSVYTYQMLRGGERGGGGENGQKESAKTFGQCQEEEMKNFIL